MRKIIFSTISHLIIHFQSVYSINSLLCKCGFHNVRDLWLLYTLTGRNEMFPYFVNWTEIKRVVYIRRAEIW